MKDDFQWWHVLLGSTLRYFLFAGVTYLFFYAWKKRQWLHFKIQKKFPPKRAINTELLFSISTLMIFSFVVYALFFTPFREHLLLYADSNAYPTWYTVISLPLIIFIHDTYFYWIHRFMHMPSIFRHVHHIHHRSHNPTPLAVFSFHPAEALLEIGVLPLIVLLLPVHRWVLALFSLYMLFMNIVGHLGFEFLPSWFLRHPVLKIFNTSTHHNMHHHYGKGNYGLYFNFWDHLMNTNHKSYRAEFESFTTEAARLAQTDHKNTQLEIHQNKLLQL